MNYSHSTFPKAASDVIVKDRLLVNKRKIARKPKLVGIALKVFAEW